MDSIHKTKKHKAKTGVQRRKSLSKGRTVKINNRLQGNHIKMWSATAIGMLLVLAVWVYSFQSALSLPQTSEDNNVQSLFADFSVQFGETRDQFLSNLEILKQFREELVVEPEEAAEHKIDSEQVTKLAEKLKEKIITTSGLPVEDDPQTDTVSDGEIEDK